MRAGRGKLPVLAEVSGFDPGADQVFSLRQTDFERLSAVHELLAATRCLLVAGDAGPAAALGIALAGAAAAAGRRTILVECDLARPRLAADLGLEPEPGLHEYLRWEARPEEVLQAIGLAGAAAGGVEEPLVFIAAGRAAPDPATLFGLRSFSHVTAKLRGAYELVVLVGPGLDEGGLGLPAVAGRADGLLAALRPAQATRRGGRQLRAALGALPVAALGAVVVADEE